MTSQKFLSIYRSLPERFKALIRLKALLYFKISSETWKACFYEIAYLFPTKTPLPILESNTLVNELKTKKLIDREEMIPSGMNHLLTLEAVQNEHGKQYLDAIETVAAQMTYRFYSQSTF